MESNLHFNDYRTAFYNYPSIDPYTHKKLTTKRYNALVKEFGDPYYNTLNLSHQEIPEDVLYNILYNASAEDIHHLCTINNMAKQLCQSNIWEEKFIHDGIPIFMYKQQFTLKDYVLIQRAIIKAEKIDQIIIKRKFLRQYTKHMNFTTSITAHFTVSGYETLDEFLFPIIFPYNFELTPDLQIDLAISFNDEHNPVITINDLAATIDWEDFQILLIKLLYLNVFSVEAFKENNIDKIKHTYNQLKY
jgi:hypothetical protein